MESTEESIKKAIVKQKSENSSERYLKKTRVGGSKYGLIKTILEDREVSMEGWEKRNERAALLADKQPKQLPQITILLLLACISRYVTRGSTA